MCNFSVDFLISGVSASHPHSSFEIAAWHPLFSNNKILLGISNGSKSEVQNGNIASWYQA